MLSLFTSCVCTSLVGVFLYLDLHQTVKNNIIEKYREFKKINRLVATNKKGSFNIMWVSLSLVIKALWINILQYINNNVFQLDKNNYEITYIIKEKTYKMIVKPIRGPSKFLIVYDENQEDVSHLIMPYIGPEEDWHGRVYTPKFFNKSELTFELSSGDHKVFRQNDNIIL